MISTNENRARRVAKAKPPRRSKPEISAGMGAIPTDKGVTFRVWAPNATAVAVTGTFNEWSSEGETLSHEGDGYWGGHIPAAGVGDEYRFLVRVGDDVLSRVDPYARSVTHSDGNGVIYDHDAFDWEGDDFVMPPWNELVIYEMHVGTFHRHDLNDGRPGDFASAMEALPYLQWLGINAIELMPPMEFPGGRSWGYNPAHIFAVESDYGGPDALKRFIKAAHAHGIAVILDVIYNHFGPGDLSTWVFDGWSENGGGGIYFYNDWRGETPWGHTRPDYGRREVRNFIRDNALMWLSEYRVDGMRWDATAYIRNVHGNDANPAADLAEGWGLMQAINREIQERFPGRLTIAEDLKNNAWLVKDVGAGGAGFGSQWDPNFVHPVRKALIGNDDAFRDLTAVRDALQFRYGDDAFGRVIYTESHDEVAEGKARIPTEVSPDDPTSWFARKRAILGAVLVLTAAGIPMLFQGQEFLKDGWFRDDRPMDWSLKNEHDGIVELFRDLIALRRNQTGVTAGLKGQHTDVFHIDDENKVLAFRRWGDNEGESVVVIVNMANRAHEHYELPWPGDGRWQARFNSDWNGYDEDFANIGSPAIEPAASTEGWSKAQLAIGPYTTLIYSRA